MKKIKEKLNEKMEYYKGLPKGTYCEVLNEMQHTKVNAWSTSSIVLAEFFAPANLEKIEKALSAKMGEINLGASLKFFEFATDPILRGRVCGQASMTDIMIMDGMKRQIAGEAKFTEYVWGKAATCESWLKERAAQRRLVMPYRSILRAWVEMIANSGCTDISMPEFYKTCMGIDYQFLHRTASACFKTNDASGQKPVLLYILFYKAGDAVHIEKMEAFKTDLRRNAELLRLKNMQFLIMSVPVTNAVAVEKRYGHLVGQESAKLFEDMKLETIYEFDFDRIDVEEVVKGGR